MSTSSTPIHELYGRFDTTGKRKRGTVVAPFVSRGRRIRSFRQGAITMSYQTEGEGDAPGGRAHHEEHRVSGDQVISKVKEVIHEGNVRRIIIKNDEGKTLIEVPLSLGVVGAVLAPMWAAIGAVAALVANCSIVVVRGQEEEEEEEEEEEAEEVSASEAGSPM